MMIQRRRSTYLILALLFLLVSCAVNPVTKKHELMLISEDQELKIGEGAAPSMKWDFGGAYHDPALESYLSDIVNRLWQSSERPNLPVTFYIQNTSIPNAFALPGYVAITRGLLSDLDSEAQFASVIGHETGHVMARHTAQRLSRVTLQQMGLAIGGAVLDDTGWSDILLTAGSIGSQLYLLKYSRDQEIEADRLGVKYMASLGYNPREALTAHEILGKSVDTYMKRMGKEAGEDTFLNTLFSTHPRKEVRLSEIEAMIVDLPPYSLRGDGLFRDRFREETKGMREINKIYFLYDEAENYYKEKNYPAAEQRLEEAISLDNRQAPFYNLLALVTTQQKNYQEADRLFRKALAIDSEYQPSVYGIGLILFLQQNYAEALSHLKRSIELYPDHVTSHFALGKSYFSLKQYREALPHLLTVSQVMPRHPEIHGLLGICYEETGKKDSAVQEYRYQLQIDPDNDLGLHAKKRLAELEPGITQ